MKILIYGTEFWNKVVNFEALVEAGTISPDDLDLLFHTDSVEEAFDYITKGLMADAIDQPGPTL